MAARASRGGILSGIAVDLKRLHATWMELIFPRQRTTHDVLGKWEPETTGQVISYRLWTALGYLVVTLLYPLVLLGFVTRFYANRAEVMFAALGIAGVTIVAAVIWGALAVVAHLRLPFDEFLAVGAAASVAIVSAALSAVFHKFGGRVTTVILAYPMAMTAIFLPPVVAALFYGPIEEIIYPVSEGIAIWVLDGPLAVGGLNEMIRDAFDLAGVGMVAMWFAIAVPVGWLLGLLVSLAEVVRPSE